MKRKFSIVLIIMFLMISILTVKANAASFTASMTASSQNVTASSEVVVTVKVSNLDVGDGNGINGFNAYISYDTDVFETLTESSIDGNNGWVPAYASTGKVSLYKNTFVKTDEEIMQISLKTKSGLTDGTQGKIQLTQIKATDSVDEMTASPVSTTITIGSGTANPPTNTNTTPITLNTNTNTNINPNNSSNNISTNNSTSLLPVNNTSNEVENVAENNMPYTGSEDGAMAKIIIGVILIALIVYIKIERMKDIK